MKYENLNGGQRLNRIIFGFALILFTMLTSTAPLGWYAILPLLATYPIFSGIYGNDPVAEFAGQRIAGIAHALGHLHIGGHRSKHV